MAQTSQSVVRRARKMRKDPTAAEKTLWRLLRGPAFAGWRFRRQHPVEPYVLDFACVTARLAVEADGGQHCENAHDEERDAFLQAQGWRVLRLWNNDILDNPEGVAQVVLQALGSPVAALRAPTPTLPRQSRGRGQKEAPSSPSPGSAGGGPPPSPFPGSAGGGPLPSPSPGFAGGGQGGGPERQRRGGTLLIGIGHPYRHDDAIGPIAAGALGGMTHHGEGSDLMTRWQGHDRVVLVDASCSGAPAGTVTVLDASDKDLPAGLLPKGSHVFGVAEGIAMARLLGKLPAELTVVAVEGRDFSAGEGLSPEVEAVLPQVLDLLRARCS